MKTKLLIKISCCLLGTLGFHSELYAGTISPLPLFLTKPSKSNTLVILDNSNSMDEASNGAAVGSSNPNSKSETARSVIRTLIDTYTGQINMGLMTYKQVAADLVPDGNGKLHNSFLHNSPYDVSFNSANYDPNFTGPRNSLKKRFRIPNPTDAGNYIYYNVALPFYAENDQGSAFCYSPTANAFKNNENPATGPWDTYRCFNTKTGAKDSWDVLPADTWGTTAQQTTLGLSGLIYNGPFNPTDSDYALDILDFGKQITWNYVSRTYSSNTSPGRGYLNNPIRLLDATQAAELKVNLACNIPTPPVVAVCTATGIKNAGLTPIEGTLLTAKDYFYGSFSSASEGYVASGAKKSYPLPQSCEKNFVILLTDGLPSTDKSGNLITSPTTAINAAASAAESLNTNGVKTYVVGFALDDPSLNKIAVEGGTTAAYSASDKDTLTVALNSIFNDILSKDNSFSSLENNSAKISSNSLLYQAVFDAVDWSGDIKAWVVKTNGDIDLTGPNWQASKQLPAHDDR
ncbi:MAG: hypothetical protein ABL925_15190, partial [Methylococcales bacterium]